MRRSGSLQIRDLVEGILRLLDLGNYDMRPTDLRNVLKEDYMTTLSACDCIGKARWYRSFPTQFDYCIMELEISTMAEGTDSWFWPLPLDVLDNPGILIGSECAHRFHVLAPLESWRIDAENCTRDDTPY